MTRHGPMLLALLVLAIASWTYNVNYDTRAALERVSKLRAQIADERENLQVLQVEWAYLNAPDRLARLVSAYNGELALVTLTPDAMGQVASVPYPRRAPSIPSLPDEFLIANAETGAATDRAEAEEAEEKEAGTAEAAADDALIAAAESDSADVIGTLIASMSDEAPSIAEDAPTTMEEAVELALAEVGIAAPAQASSAGVAASASVIAASSAGMPMPPARPAVLARR